MEGEPDQLAMMRVRCGECGRMWSVRLGERKACPCGDTAVFWDGLPIGGISQSAIESGELSAVEAAVRREIACMNADAPAVVPGKEPS